jgi:hypothetical protein
MARGQGDLIPSMETPRATPRGFWIAAAVVLLVALLLRVALLAADAFPFNADEAVVGLMARHIRAGSWPVFFYGQAYMGSLDAALVAAAFAGMGEAVATIRIVQTALYLATILTTMTLVRAMGFSTLVCALAGALLAVPSVNVTLYTTISLGGYGEALLLGNLILLATIHLIRGSPRGWAYFLWGVLTGFALWAFGLTLVYALPAAVVLVGAAGRRVSRRATLRSAAAILIGVFVGALPMSLWAVAHGPQALVGELTGSAISGASPGGWLRATASHLVNLILFAPTVLLGLRPPWAIAPLGMPLAPLAAVLWLVAIGFGLRVSAWPPQGRVGRTLLLAMTGTLLVGFVATPFGADPSGRYFLPLAVPLAVFGAVGIQAVRDLVGRPWPLALAVVVLGFNLWTNVQASRAAPGFTTQFDAETVFDHRRDAELVAFLEDHRASAGYATYWVAYPLAFLSRERLVYLPHLPYHSDFRYSARDDRYAPYRAVVAGEARPAYITARQPWLDEVVRSRLRARGVSFQETSIGDYRVFFDLSATVRPADLGLGPEAPP